MPEILSRWTHMRVLEGQNGMLIEANRVYVPPPDTVVTLKDGRLGVHLTASDDTRIPRPVDAFFDSLGSALGAQSIGIVLSGTGSDGALGLKAIKQCGGLTIAQASAGSAPQYREMPAGAIATGSVDLVAPIKDIPGHLMRIKVGPSALFEDEGCSVDTARLKICEILRAQLGHDFSGYRDKTFLRRVERRMNKAAHIFKRRSGKGPPPPRSGWRFHGEGAVGRHSTGATLYACDDQASALNALAARVGEMIAGRGIPK